MADHLLLDMRFHDRLAFWSHFCAESDSFCNGVTCSSHTVLLERQERVMCPMDSVVIEKHLLLSTLKDM